jgi:hypothetical protein
MQVPAMMGRSLPQRNGLETLSEAEDFNQQVDQMYVKCVHVERAWQASQHSLAVVA